MDYHMSFENVPKNVYETAVLIEPNPPKYVQLSTDAIPMPAVADRGALLEFTDTGDEYRWNGVHWRMTRDQGVLVVHSPELGHPPVGNKFYSLPVTTTTLSVAAATQTRLITVTSITGLSIGNTLRISQMLIQRSLPVIVAIAGNVITLDRLLDYDLPIGTLVERVYTNLNRVGTAAAPILFRLGPPVGERWHMTRMLLAMTHASAGDLGKFGNLPPLTYGLVGRIKKAGKYFTYFSWVSNAELKSTMFDVDFDTRSGGGGTYGTSGRFTFTNAGTSITLDGTAGDEIQLLVQDNLTGLLSFSVQAQGHIGELLLI